MQLDSTELSDLAGFFARRFPGEGQRAAFASRLGLSAQDVGDTPPSVAWRAVLDALQEEDRLPDLARLASREGGDDENLQAVCRVLAGERRSMFASARARGLGIGAAALAAALVISVVVFSGADVAPTAHASALTDASPLTAPAPAPEATAVGEPSPTQAAAQAPVPSASVSPPAATPAPVRAAAPEMDPAHADGRCTTREGGVVGYWYAGRTSPGAQGATITVAQAVRVRSDYPDVHNQFNARAPIRCFLTPGDTVRLSAAPIHVPGDAWWVPLHSGDLIAQ